MNLNRIYLNLIFIFCSVHLHLSTVSAQSLCSSLFQNENINIYVSSNPENQKSTSLSQKISNYKAMIFPKLGLASYSSKEYDISLVGKYSQLMMSPQIVIQETSKTIDSFISKLKSSGLKTKSRTHYVFEMSDNAIGYKDGSLHGFCHQSIEKVGPFTQHEGIGLMIDGFLKRKIPLKSQKNNKLVVMPFNYFGGPKIHKFVLAHEIGHDVFFSVNPSMNEAMADYVAWFLSDLTSFYEPTISYKVAPNQFRDISNPRIVNVQQLEPSLAYYHINSTIFSHLFWKIDQVYGKGSSISLIQFIESKTEQIPYLTHTKPTRYKNDEGYYADLLKEATAKAKKNKTLINGYKRFILNDKNNNNIPHRKIFVNRDTEEVKFALIESFKDFGQIIRDWAKNHNNEGKDVVIESFLNEAGI